GDYSSPHPGEPTQYDINISHPLDYSHKRKARVRSAVMAKTVAEAQFQDDVRNRIDGLYTVYVDAQQAKERVWWAKGDLDRWDALLEATREQPSQDTLPTGGVGQIESARQLATLTHSEAKAVLARTKRSLGVLLGLPAEESDRFEVEMLDFADRPIPPI